jgi:hypothetical protein
MENTTTVRIDLQRLQVLNDRLCQTLEALNQVRMSCHNVHAGAWSYGLPAVTPYNTLPGYGVSTFGVPSLGAYGIPSIPTPSIYGSPIYGSPAFGMNGFVPSVYGTPAFGAPLFAGAPVTYSNGIDRTRAAAFTQPTIW